MKLKLLCAALSIFTSNFQQTRSYLKPTNKDILVKDVFNTLNANPTKWTNSLKKFVGLKWLLFLEVVDQRCYVKKGFLKIFVKLTGKHLCWILFLLRKTPTQLFSCDLCEIFKNTYFIEHLQRAAFVCYSHKYCYFVCWKNLKKYCTF